MASLHDADALLIYEVGPVRCCAPTGPIEQIVLPPDLTHPPGSDAARPGIFRHGRHIVSVIDLRQRFGIEPDRWQPGRLVITQLARGYTGFWVDRIVDVIRSPTEGWGGLPPHLPRDTFSRTLLYRDQIHLYTEFEQLPHLHPAGFLRQYLAQLEPAAEPRAPAAQTVSEHQPRALQTDDAPPPARETTSPTNATARPDPGPATTQSAPLPAPSLAAEPPETRQAPNAAGTKASRAATPAEPRRSDSADPTPQSAPAPEPTTPARPMAPATPGAATGTDKPSPPPHTPPVNDHLEPGGQSIPRPAPPTSPAAGATSPASTPSTPKSAPSPVGEDSGGGPGALLVLLLLLGGGAAGVYLWYPAGDIPDPVAISDRPAPRPVLPTPPPERESDVAPRPAAREPITPIVPTEAPVSKPVSTPVPEPRRKPAPGAAAQTETVSPTTPETPPHTLGGLVHTAPPYRASIEQNSDGITLIFEAPAPAVPAVAAPPNEPAGEPEPQDGSPTAIPSAVEQTDASASDASTTPPPDREDIVHVVARGDTLWDIAKRYVDNPWRYPELAENSDIHNPDLIYPGDKVHIIIYRGRRP